MDILSTTLTFCTVNWRITIVLVLISLLSWHYFSNFTILKKLGINGAQPLPFFGNTLPMFTGTTLYKMLSETIEKYGKVCGFYFFNIPVVIVVDPEMLKSILIKDFDKFHDKTLFTIVEIEPMKNMVNVAQGQQWKNIRSVLTPAFTSGKLKQMMFIIDKASDTLLMKLEKAANERVAIDIHQWQRGLTMEVILSATFGVQAESQTNPNDKTTKLAKLAVAPRSLSTGLALLVPVIGRWLASKFAFSDRFGFPCRPLVKLAKGIIKQRKENSGGDSDRKDMLGLMLDSQKADAKGYHLTENEITAQMIAFIIAGYESSSSILSLTCYHFAAFPEIQEKAFEEIKEVCATNDAVSYEEVQKMPYLEACISETIRLYPPVFSLRRQVTESCTVNGVRFKKGMVVFVPTYHLHHDEKYWPEPETFKPERFLPENKDSINQFTYLPFGDGPRNCVAMRFANLQMKTVLARMLQKFRIVKGPEFTPIKIQASGHLGPAEPVLIRIEKRV